MNTTEQWLEEKRLSYKANANDMLLTTTNAIEQYLKNPTTAGKEVLDSIIIRNKSFLQSIKSAEHDLYLSPVSGSLYVHCAQCKSIEDTFEDGEIPNDFGWVYHRKKWYCKPCYTYLSKIPFRSKDFDKLNDE